MSDGNLQNGQNGANQTSGNGHPPEESQMVILERRQARQRPGARRSWWLRAMLLSVAGVLTLVMAMIGAGAWYVSTAGFQQKVRLRVIALLEQATGGRVELQGLRFSLWRFDAVADHLVIHGLEGAGEAPYAQVDRAEIRLQLRTFLTQSVGANMVNDSGVALHIAVTLLQVDRPQVHLIVYADGSTNQPTPKIKSTSNKPLADTLLDLQAERVALNNGTVLLNDRKIPFNLAARDLTVKASYQPKEEMYDIGVGLSNLQTQMESEPMLESRLDAELALGRQLVELRRLEFDGGKSQLKMSGSLENFNHPRWAGTATGSVDLVQFTALTGFNGFTGGSTDLNLYGRNCIPAATGNAPAAKPRAQKSATPDGCTGTFVVTGSMRLHRAGFTDDYVAAKEVDGSITLRATPDALQLGQLDLQLPGGGAIAGNMHIDRWLSAVEPVSKKVDIEQLKPLTAAALVPIAPGAAHAYIDAQVKGLPLRTVMDFEAPKNYGDLGFDTAATGPVHIEFGYDGNTVMVAGNLQFAPTGAHRAGARSDVPVTGSARARYLGGNETVLVEALHANTPATVADANGILGVNTGDPLTQLKTDVTTRDLGEFDQLFRTLGLEYKGKKGMETVPLKLRGDAHFTGTASGEVEMLDVKGHLTGENVELTLPQIPPLTGTRTIMIDSVAGDAEYNPAELQITRATVTRGSVTMTAAGKVLTHRVPLKHGLVEYDWDKAAVVDARMEVLQGQAPDLMDIAGVKTKLSGTVKMNAQVTGTFGNMEGSGMVRMTKGAFYSEPYERAEVDLSVHGQDISTSRAVVTLPAGEIAGAGDYDLQSGHLRAQAQAGDLKLARLKSVAANAAVVDADVSVQAQADGTMAEPGLHATMRAANLTLDGAAMGEMNAEMHSERSTLLYTAGGEIGNGQFALTGSTELKGDYETNAKLKLAAFDVDSLLKLYAPHGITGHSAIGGTVTLNGPLGAPHRLNGVAEIDQFKLNLSGVELETPQPLRATLQNGLLRIDQAHITGQGTDLTARGTAQLATASGAAGPLHMRAEGKVNLKLAQSLDPDIISSGGVDLAMDAGGSVSSPVLTGKVKFHDVAIAMEDVPNGLSKMNGTLVFNQDRLQVESLTAMSGGGQLTIGGFMSLKHGFYADMTATGDAVRVRLNGLSSTANSSLRLQGSTANALLSGNILITRFGIGPDFDFAAFANPGSIITPHDPNAPSSHIRLDVRVTSSPQLDFQNSYAKLAGTVDLRIGGTVAVPAVLGRITVTDGSAKFAGQQYQLQRGNVLFSNPVRIDPLIDLDATTRVENYDVTVGIHGTLSNMKPTYRSEPPLSETDIFALLALGRTQEEAQLYQQQNQIGADPMTSAVLGSALNATVSSRVEKLFGVGNVKIDPAFVGTLGTSSVRITVEQQLSRNLTVTYATNVNQTAEQLVALQLNLTENVSVVAERDENGVFSTVLKIRRRYR